MKKYILVLFLCHAISLPIGAQTSSDSLYFTKLYPLKNKGFLLIGSEVRGSFRKAVLRVYDQDMKVKNQVQLKNMRNSDIFLDEEFSGNFRIISRYRWNRGHVLIYSHDLKLQSARFFKRDDYKDWQHTEDEEAGYPLRGQENLFGLDPVYYQDSVCYFFDKQTKIIFVSKSDFTFIKPEYKIKATLKLRDAGVIDTYKFYKTADDQVLFYYSTVQNGKRTNYFTFLKNEVRDRDIKGFEINNENNKKSYFISDVSYDPSNGCLVAAGSYVDSGKITDGNIKISETTDGYFFDVLIYKKESNEIRYFPAYNDTIVKPDRNKPTGFRCAKLLVSDFVVEAVMEKITMEEKSVELNNGMELSGSYYTYRSESSINVNYNIQTDVIHQFEIPLKYNLSNEKKYFDKDWRTLHRLKNQKMQHLIFNGINSYGYNDLSITHIDLLQKKTVYSDRNYNYYLCDWSGEEPMYRLLYENTRKTRCFFYDGFFSEYYKTDWGFVFNKKSY